MSTNLPFDSPAESGADRLAAAAGRIPPGLTGLAFRDAWGPSPEAKASEPQRDDDDSAEKASSAHVFFSALVALASIFLVAVTR